MPKDAFPKQLKQLHNSVMINLVPGFLKAGIYPVGSEEILKRLPHCDKNDKDTSLVGDTFMNVLSEMRSESCTEPIQKRKKENAPAGRSVGPGDIIRNEGAELPVIQMRLLYKK